MSGNPATPIKNGHFWGCFHSGPRLVSHRLRFWPPFSRVPFRALPLVATSEAKSVVKWQLGPAKVIWGVLRAHNEYTHEPHTYACIQAFMHPSITAQMHAIYKVLDTKTRQPPIFYVAPSVAHVFPLLCSTPSQWASF